MTNSQWKLARFWSLKSIFRHGKRRLYGIDSICTRPGGHLLAEWGAFEISQSLNFEHVFQGFLRQFEDGEKTGRYLDVFKNNMAKKLFWYSKYSWNGGALNPKVCFSNKKASRKNSLLVSVLLQKSMSVQRKPKMRRFCQSTFLLSCLWFSKNGFFWRFKSSNFCISFFNPKRRQIQKCALIEPPHFGQRTSWNLNFSKKCRGKGFPSTSFFKIQIQIETVVMTSRSQKLAHLEILLRLITGENFV